MSDSESPIPVLISGFTEAADHARRQKASRTIERLHREIAETEAILADESMWSAMHLTGGLRLAPVRTNMRMLEAELNAQLEADGYRVTITVEQVEQS